MSSNRFESGALKMERLQVCKTADLGAQESFTTYVSVQADAEHAALPTMSVQKLITDMFDQGDIALIPQYACDVTLTCVEHFTCKARVQWTTVKGMSMIHISPASPGTNVLAAFPLQEGMHPVTVVRGAMRYLDRTE